jgi:hypothetical protein
MSSHLTKDLVRDALVTAALFGSVSVACAQQPAPNSEKSREMLGQSAESANKPATPSRVPGGDGVEEPSAKQAAPPAAGPGIFINGKLTVPGAANDTATTPALFSATNDRLDRVPIMARGPELTESQRKLILDRVMSNNTGAPVNISAAPTTILPSSVEMQAWPADVASAIPAIRGTKFVKLADKVLVVLPENWIVVEEIAR